MTNEIDLSKFIDTGQIGKTERVKFRWERLLESRVIINKLIGGGSQSLADGTFRCAYFPTTTILRVNPNSENTQPVPYRSHSIVGKPGDYLIWHDGEETGKQFVHFRRYVSTTPPKHEIFRAALLVQAPTMVAVAVKGPPQIHYAQCTILAEIPFVFPPPTQSFKRLVKNIQTLTVKASVVSNTVSDSVRWRISEGL